jgi:hypothetical protein
MARDIENIADDVKDFAPAMVELGIEPPRIIDFDEDETLWDMHRALTQLRQRLSVSLGGNVDDIPGPEMLAEGVAAPLYAHETNLGLMNLRVKEMGALRLVADSIQQAGWGAGKTAEASALASGVDPDEAAALGESVRSAEIESILNTILAGSPLVDDYDWTYIRSELEKKAEEYRKMAEKGKYPKETVFEATAKKIGSNPTALERLFLWGNVYDELGRFYGSVGPEGGIEYTDKGEPIEPGLLEEKRRHWREMAWRDPNYLVEQMLPLMEMPDLFSAGHAEWADRALAQLNPKKRRNPRNPLTPDEAAIVAKYLEDEKEAAQADLVLAAKAGAASKQGLDPQRVAAIFPREGKLQGRGVQTGSWDAESRIPAALEAYDLVSRVGAPDPPSQEIVESLEKRMGKGENPLQDEDAIKYLKGAMGMSLDEAAKVLNEMKKSAQGRRSKTGERIAMQPSSAMCKLYRVRKLPYEAPREMLNKAGSKSVVILMGPDDDNPRVMTWRRGAHIDCDMVASNRSGLLQVLSRALQSAVFWVAEKPGRKKSNRIFVGQVGTTGLWPVWKPGQKDAEGNQMPLSMATIVANLQMARKTGALVTYQSKSEAKQDIRNYDEALSKIGKTRHRRDPDKPPPPPTAPSGPPPSGPPPSGGGGGGGAGGAGTGVREEVLTASGKDYTVEELAAQIWEMNANDLRDVMDVYGLPKQKKGRKWRRHEMQAILERVLYGEDPSKVMEDVRSISSTRTTGLKPSRGEREPSAKRKPGTGTRPPPKLETSKSAEGTFREAPVVFRRGKAKTSEAEEEALAQLAEIIPESGPETLNPATAEESAIAAALGVDVGTVQKKRSSLVSDEARLPINDFLGKLLGR